MSSPDDYFLKQLRTRWQTLSPQQVRVLPSQARAELTRLLRMSRNSQKEEQGSTRGNLLTRAHSARDSESVTAGPSESAMAHWYFHHDESFRPTWAEQRQDDFASCCEELMIDTSITRCAPDPETCCGIENGAFADTTETVEHHRTNELDLTAVRYKMRHDHRHRSKLPAKLRRRLTEWKLTSLSFA